jgi:GNAT superfamily N-acetyltransferase
MTTPSPIPSTDHADVFDVERIRAMRMIADHAEGGWFVGDDELGALFTGADTITANGIVSARADVPVEELEALRSQLGVGQKLLSVQVGEAASAAQIEWAAALGLRRVGGIPTMTMDIREAMQGPEHPFRIRRAGPDDSDAMSRCIAAAFEQGSLARSAPFANPGLLARPEVTGFVVEGEGGQVVSMGLATMTVPDVVGLWVIGTLPEHARQGHGAAVTRALLNEARDQGASVAYLQASPEGAPLYARLGFTVDAVRTYMY